RRRLLEVARAEFIAHGFRRTSMSTIAARAGVARSTLFRHCGDKDALVRDVVVRDVLDYAAEYLATAPTLEPSERLVEAFVAGMRAFRTHPLAQAIIKFDPEMFAELIGQPDVLDQMRTVVASQLTTDTIDFDTAVRAAELILRITVSVITTPSSVLRLDTDDHTRAFARLYFLPLIEAARTDYTQPDTDER
ncbi:MAG TPA: helix-turn-helix domain-containing protein, partial [Pseudonocardia sp.]